MKDAYRGIFIFPSLMMLLVTLLVRLKMEFLSGLIMDRLVFTMNMMSKLEGLCFSFILFHDNKINMIIKAMVGIWMRV